MKDHLLLQLVGDGGLNDNIMRLQYHFINENTSIFDAAHLQ